jgi:hypothetical protein
MPDDPEIRRALRGADRGRVVLAWLAMTRYPYNEGGNLYVIQHAFVVAGVAFLDEDAGGGRGVRLPRS